MAYVLEVDENGTLTLPAEVLAGAKPHMRFTVEERDEGLLVRPEDATTEDADEWWREWDKLTEEVSAAWKGDKSAVETISEMRR